MSIKKNCVFIFFFFYRKLKMIEKNTKNVKRIQHVPTNTSRICLFIFNCNFLIKKLIILYVLYKMYLSFCT